MNCEPLACSDIKISVETVSRIIFAKKSNMKNKGLMTLLGYLLFALGMLSIILSIVGVKLAFLSWIDNWGRLTGFLIKLFMLVIGMIIMFVARADWPEELEDA